MAFAQEYQYEGLGISKKWRRGLIYGGAAAAVGGATYFGGKKAGWWGQGTEPPGKVISIPKRRQPPARNAIRIPKKPGSAPRPFLSSIGSTLSNIASLKTQYDTAVGSQVPSIPGQAYYPEDQGMGMPQMAMIGAAGIVGLVVLKKLLKK